MKVGLIQLVSRIHWQDNQDEVRDWVRKAKLAGAELVALPEHFYSIGSDLTRLRLGESAEGGQLQTFLKELAKEQSIGIVGGTIPVLDPESGKLFNRMLVVNAQGEVLTYYDKIHLFQFSRGREHYNEAALFVAGEKPVGLDWMDQSGISWRIGLSVCYDLRFPELYRAWPADIWIVASAFTQTTGKAHWEILLRARAIENLAYVLAPAQGGTHESGRQTWGHTMAVDPWGVVLAEQASGPGLVLVDLDKTVIQTYREQLPALSHRKTYTSFT